MSEHEDEVFEEAAGVVMNGAANAVRTGEALVRTRQVNQQQRTQDTRDQTDQLTRRFDAHAVGAERFYASTSDRLDDLSTGSPAEAAAVWHGAHVWADLDRERFGPYADRFNEHLSELVGINVRQHVTTKRAAIDQTEPAVVDLITRRGRAGSSVSANDAEQRAARHHRDADADLSNADAAGVGDVDHGDLHTRAAIELQASDVDVAEAGHWRSGAEESDLDDLPASTAAYDTPERRSGTEESLRAAGVSDRAIAARMKSDRLNGQHPYTAALSASPTKTSRPRARLRASRKARVTGLER